LSDPAIQREEDDAKGRYTLVVEGRESELTYTRLAQTQVIANHTGVPDALSGRGIGTKLVERLVEDARAEGFRIVPLCPFVAVQARKHPEWADAFKM
jgi:uncharacterized protein